MKNEVNRALVAKKKNYINPSVQVAQFAPMSLMQAASPAATNMNIVPLAISFWLLAEKTHLRVRFFVLSLAYIKFLLYLCTAVLIVSCGEK